MTVFVCGLDEHMQYIAYVSRQKQHKAKKTKTVFDITHPKQTVCDKNNKKQSIIDRRYHKLILRSKQ